MRKLLSVLTAIGLLFLAMAAPASAAPDGSISNIFCNATKIGNDVRVSAGGSYFASTGKTDYLINGYRIDLRNSGGQQLRSTGLVAISPTYTYTAVSNWTIPFRTASNLQDMKLDFYNGKKVKASTGWVNCTWN